MKTIKTIHHTIHSDCDDDMIENPPAQVVLCSTVQRLSHERSWYVQGGSESWHFQVATFEHVTGWLTDNGYKVNGELPPDCFEYTFKPGE